MAHSSIQMTFLLSLLFAGAAVAQEWTRFRGPDGQGISAAKGIPVQWTDQDYRWRVRLPAGGHSSPVIWGQRVFVTCEDPNSPGGILLALDTGTGAVLWQKQYKLKLYRFHSDNSYAAATPAVDADYVYVLWQTAAETILAALDHGGQEIWRRNLPGIHSQFGPGTSPIVFGDVVVLTHEQEGDETYPSTWIALDRRTGQTRWSRQRQNSETSCSTPCVYRPEGERPQLIFTSETHGVTSTDPDTGSVLWELPSVLPARVVGSPVLAGDILISTCGKGSTGNQLVAVRVPAGNGGQQPKLVYTHTGRSVPYVPTPLTRDGLLYTFHDQGEVRCLRVDTGKLLWSEKPAGRFYGSPVWVNGLLYCIDRQGRVVVLAAGATYKLLAVNSLGEKSHATPAVAENTMYLRTYSHLISIGEKRR